MIFGSCGHENSLVQSCGCCSGVHRPLRRLAVDANDMKNPHFWENMIMQYIVCYNPVEELLLVVGDNEPVECERDIEFVEPLKRPAETFDCLEMSRYMRMRTQARFANKWHLLEESMSLIVEAYIVNRTLKRQDMVDCKLFSNSQIFYATSM